MTVGGIQRFITSSALRGGNQHIINFIQDDRTRWGQLNHLQMRITLNALSSGNQHIIDFIENTPERWTQLTNEQMSDILFAFTNAHEELARFIEPNSERWRQLNPTQMFETANSLTSDNDNLIRFIEATPERWTQLTSEQMLATSTSLRSGNQSVIAFINNDFENWNRLEPDEMGLFLRNAYLGRIITIPEYHDIPRASREIENSLQESVCVITYNPINELTEPVALKRSGNIYDLYEKDELLKWIRKNEKNPVTRAKVTFKKMFQPKTEEQRILFRLKDKNIAE